MDILKRPQIEYEKKPGLSSPHQVITSAEADYTLTRERVLELLSEMEHELGVATDAVDGDLRYVGVSLPDGEVKDALVTLTGNNAYSVLGYAGYIAGLTSGTRQGLGLAQAYRQFNTSVWGNSSVVLSDMLRLIATEANRMRSHLVENDEDEETLVKLAQWIGDSADVARRVSAVVNSSDLDESTIAEMSNYTVGELRGAQVYMDKHVSTQIGQADKGLAVISSLYSGTAADSFYGSLGNTKAVAVDKKSNGLFGTIIEGVSGAENMSALLTDSNLVSRIETFSSVANDVIDAIATAKLGQKMNDEIVSRGGITSAEASAAYTTTPDPAIEAQIARDLLGTDTPTLAVTYVRETASDLYDLSTFVAVDDFEYLKSLLFFDGTELINGANVAPGTLNIGAVMVGERPLILDILWGENMLEVDPAQPIDPANNYMLSHTAGSVVARVDDEPEVFTINAGVVSVAGVFDGGGSPRQASESNKVYWLYISLDTSGKTAEIVAYYEKQPASDSLVKIGLWVTTGATGRLITSYGVTLINGNSIITGTVVADLVRGGKSSYEDNTHAGYWMGRDIDGKYKLAISNGDGTVGLFWDGTTLIIAGGTSSGQTVDTAAGAMTMDEIMAYVQAQAVADATTYADGALTDFATTLNARLDDMQNQLDGQVDYWFYDGAPTLLNLPASGWTTEQDKLDHVGDLYYDNTTGYGYRFARDTETSVYSWLEMTDSTAVAALAAAQAAQDTADHKRRVFTAQPTVPYDVGDLWLTSLTDASGDIYKCITEQPATGAYSAAHWVKASRYTDDTRANEAFDAIDGAIADAAADATAKADAAEAAAIAAAALDAATRASAAEDAAIIAAAADATAKMNLAKADAAAAAAAAAAAQTDATAANTAITEVTSDTVFSPVEKSMIRKEWDELYAEHLQLDAQADSYGTVTTIDSAQTALDTSFTALGTYLNNGAAWTIGATIPSWINDTNLSIATNPIVGSTFRAKFKDYYEKRQLLYKAISDKAKALADAAQGTATSAQTAASNAQTAADKKARTTWKATAPTVYSDGLTPSVGDIWISTATGPTNGQISVCSTGGASPVWTPALDTSKNRTFYLGQDAGGLPTPAPSPAATTGDLWYNTTTGVWYRYGASSWQPVRDTQLATFYTEVSSDDKVTSAERIALKREYDLVVAEKTQYDARATAAGVSATTYDSKWSALKTFLDPIIADTNPSTTIVGSTMRTRFSEYYMERAALDAAILSATTTRLSTVEGLTNDMVLDNMISAPEKSIAKMLWDAIPGEYTAVLAQATALNVPATDYTTAYNNLNTYLNTTLAVFSNMGVATNVTSATTWRNTWKAYYDAESALRQAIITAQQNLAEGKTDTYYQASQPYANLLAQSAQDATYERRLRDMWYDTDGGYVDPDTGIVGPISGTYVFAKTNVGSKTAWTNAASWDYKWVQMTIPKDMFDLLDGKRQVFTLAATDYTSWTAAYWKTGDLWITTGPTGGNGLKRAKTNKSATTTVDAVKLAGDWEYVATDDTLASAANTAAEAAASNASAANGRIDNIASDNILTPVEKTYLRKEWDTLYAEYIAINTKADFIGVNAPIDAAQADVTAKLKLLGNYLNNGSTWTVGATPPLFLQDAQLATQEPRGTGGGFTGAALRTNFKAYYDARQTLYDQIALYFKNSSSAQSPVEIGDDGITVGRTDTGVWSKLSMSSLVFKVDGLTRVEVGTSGSTIVDAKMSGGTEVDDELDVNGTMFLGNRQLQVLPIPGVGVNIDFL